MTERTDHTASGWHYAQLPLDMPGIPDVPELWKPKRSSGVYGVPWLHDEGREHDEVVFNGAEDEYFPTSLWYVGRRNEKLAAIAEIALGLITENGNEVPEELPSEVRYGLVTRYADFEIACKTSINKLGFDPIELRQRTLAYREKKYPPERMSEIRTIVRAGNPNADEVDIEALVKAQTKQESALVTRFDGDLGFEHVDVSSYQAQIDRTVAWEQAFTNGKGQDFRLSLGQLLSELDECQREILVFFAAHNKDNVDDTFDERRRYELAAEIDDIGVAGLGILAELSIDINPIMQDRLQQRKERYDPEVIKGYYALYDNMQLALEATRNTQIQRVFVGGTPARVRQLNFLLSPNMREAVPDMAYIHRGLERYTRGHIQEATGKNPGDLEEADVGGWRKK